MVLLSVQYEEGNSFLLINLKSKQKINLISPPVFSKNYTRVLTFENQGEADYGEHGFKLLKQDERVNTGNFSHTTPILSVRFMGNGNRTMY